MKIAIAAVPAGAALLAAAWWYSRLQVADEAPAETVDDAPAGGPDDSAVEALFNAGQPRNSTWQDDISEATMSTINRVTGTDASTMKVSPAGEAFIKEHEGLSLKRYELGDGGWTIGYGHFYPYSGPEPALEITREQADALFRDDIEVAGAKRVRAYVTAPLTQSQFDALASMAFGLSTKSFRAIADAVNRGEDPEPYMLRYVRAGTNLEKGLRRMRAKEIALYRSEGVATA